MNRRKFLGLMGGAALGALLGRRPTTAAGTFTVSIPLVTGGQLQSGVWRTASGSKYHKQGCHYLTPGAYKVSCEAAAADKLTPCSACDPVCGSVPIAPTATPAQVGPTPTPSSGAPWRTKSGSKYHKAGCHYLTASAYATTCEQVLVDELTPCSACKPTCP